MALDSARIKQLLQSTDTSDLHDAIEQLHSMSDSLEDRRQQEQVCKVQILLYNRVLQVDPTDAMQVEALQKIAQLWLDMGEHDKAIGQLKRALQMDDKNTDTIQQLGDTYMYASNYGEATALHEQAIGLLETPTDRALALCRLAAVLEAHGEFDAAKTELATAQTLLDTDDADSIAFLFRQVGQLQYKLGEYGDAVDSLTKAHEALSKAKGDDHPKTKDVAYLLQMASNLAADGAAGA